VERGIYREIAHNPAVLSGPVERIARKVRAALVSAPIVGASYVTGLTAWSLVRSRNTSVEGSLPMVVVVVTAIALGLFLGLVAHLLIRLRHSLARRARRSPAGALVEAALLVTGLHAALVGWSMADSPQLYAARWYAQGGLPRTLQVIATDVLRPGGVVLATLALLVVYLRPARVARSLHWLFTVAVGPLSRFAKKSALPIAALAIALGALSESARPVRAAQASEAEAPAGARTKGGEPLNVLVLAASCLRADRLDPRVAPNLTKLAARATSFDRAYVSMPRTLPSWVTLLTGRHAHHHGVRSTLSTRDGRTKDLDALPGRFAKAGYRTAVVSDVSGEAQPGFAKSELGFGRIDLPSSRLRPEVRRASLEGATPILPLLHSQLGRRVFPALRGLDVAADPLRLAGDVETALRSMKDGPFFATVLFSSTGAPYAAPAPYYTKYTDRSYRGRFKYDASSGRGDGAEVLDEDDVQQVRALYDGAVSSVDAAIGRVLAALERLDLADRTIVVVTADHGESLFDHGRGQGHGDQLFGDEGTHVPLVIYDPRLAPRHRERGGGATTDEVQGRREPAVVRDVDLAPTLYELTGVTPPADLDGRSLVPALRGLPLEERLAYAETGEWLTERIPGLPPELRIPYPGERGLTERHAQNGSELVFRKDMEPVVLMARHRMVRDARWKLVYVPTRMGVRYFLFDTARDPAEREDVAASHPEVVSRLRTELWSWMVKDRAMEQRDGYLVPRDTSSTAPVEAEDGYEVAVRLVENALAPAAAVDAPHVEAARAPNEAKPRPPPFVARAGAAARLVRSVAPEGSLDRREALVSPSPGTIRFRVHVPRGAKLTFGEGILEATGTATTFSVSVLDGRGALREVHRHVHAPSAGWSEASCDLSEFAGQDVELRFATESAKASPGVRKTARTGPVALWGSPTILAKAPSRVPYNVLWISAGGLRPDAVASFHDDAVDAAKHAAPLPPLEALLPKVPGLTPAIDELARRGARFTNAYSAGAWRRPGTFGMLTGARPSELGIERTDSTATPARAARFHASDPPLLPLALRRQNVTTLAFTSDEALVGEARAGVDLGFERVVARRSGRDATSGSAQDASRWIEANRDTRFFAFVSFDSPRAPYEPSPQHLERVPPQLGPKDVTARRYLAKAAAVDDAVGVLMRTLERTGLRERTIVVLTATHGETLSPAHRNGSEVDEPAAAGNSVRHFEEATKVPIVVAAPGLLPSDVDVKARVRSIDLAPTTLALLGLEPHARTSGRSLVPLAKGREEAAERVVVSEGFGTRSILHGRWRLLVHDAPTSGALQGLRPLAELYDLVDDPGERRDLARTHPEIVAEMRARLEAASKNVRVAGAAELAGVEPATVRLRFVGGATSRRVSGTIRVGGGSTKPTSFEVHPIELGHDAFHLGGDKIEIAVRTSPSGAVGFDIVVDPPGTPITWDLWLDDGPWPENGVFGGRFGLPSPALHEGVASDEARWAARSAELPMIEPGRDVGLFVVRSSSAPAPFTR